MIVVVGRANAHKTMRSAEKIVKRNDNQPVEHFQFSFAELATRRA